MTRGRDMARNVASSRSSSQLSDDRAGGNVRQWVNKQASASVNANAATAGAIGGSVSKTGALFRLVEFTSGISSLGLHNSYHSFLSPFIQVNFVFLKLSEVR